MNNAEAIEKLARLVTLHRKHSSSTKIAQAIINAIGADLFTYFPPKPLVWQKDIHKDCLTTLRCYDIYEATANFTGSFIIGPPDPVWGNFPYPTLDAAKTEVETQRLEALAKEFSNGV